jgi:hypothetical protein
MFPNAGSSADATGTGYTRKTDGKEQVPATAKSALLQRITTL